MAGEAVAGEEAGVGLAFVGGEVTVIADGKDEHAAGGEAHAGGGLRGVRDRGDESGGRPGGAGSDIAAAAGGGPGQGGRVGTYWMRMRL